MSLISNWVELTDEELAYLQHLVWQDASQADNLDDLAFATAVYIELGGDADDISEEGDEDVR